MQQDKLFDKGSDRLQHKQTHWLGFLEINWQTCALGVLSDKRLNEEAAERQRPASRPQFQEHTGLQCARGMVGGIGKGGSPLDAPGCGVGVGLWLESSGVGGRAHELLEGFVLRRRSRIGQDDDEVDILREALDQPVCLGEACAALEDD